MSLSEKEFRLNTKEIMEKMLDNEDLEKIIGFPLHIIPYNQLEKFKTIEELLQPYGAAIILYVWQNQPNTVGHWVAVLETKPGIRIEFFDPYGLKPDDEKKFIPPHLWKMNYMSRLLYNASKRGWEIEYNQYPFQKNYFDDINTCGRWVAFRIRMKRLPLEDFRKLIQQGNGGKSIANDKDTDYLITALTFGLNKI